MSVQTEDPDIWMTTELRRDTGSVRAPRRRVPGLRLPALPSWPLVAQVVGAVATLTGVYLQWGSAVALIVGGAAAVLVGMLKESDRI